MNEQTTTTAKKRLHKTTWICVHCVLELNGKPKDQPDKFHSTEQQPCIRRV